MTRSFLTADLLSTDTLPQMRAKVNALFDESLVYFQEDDNSGNVSYNYAEGRLTLTSLTPVTTADVTGASATTLYYARHTGSRLSLFANSEWGTYTFSNSLAISIPATTETLYDVFAYVSAGAPTLELLAWTGTGITAARATSLSRQDGILVKSTDSTRRYIGTISTAAGSGQSADSTARRLVYNEYNKVPKTLGCEETTASWAYSSATVRATNASVASGVARVDFIQGNAGMPVEATSTQLTRLANNAAITANPCLIGVDSITAESADMINTGNVANGNSSADVTGFTESVAYLLTYPAAGYHFLNRLEGGSASGTFTSFGSANSYNCGMRGIVYV